MKKLFTRLLGMVDSESVRLFIWPYYFAFLAFGLYATIHGWPSNVVEPVMGNSTYLCWLWMHIPATLFVLIGLLLRHGGKPVHEMNAPLLFADFIGLYMQRGGHLAVFCLLSVYDFTVIRGGNFYGQAMYSFFILLPYTMGCLLLALQVHRKIHRGDLLHREGKVPS